MLVEWNDEHALGYDVIDTGHRLVIDAINHLNDCSGAKADRAVMAEVLRTLHGHLPQQFHHEETLMMMARSQHLPEQRAEHARMMATLSTLSTRFETGEDIANLLLLNLVAFLKTHLRGSDRDEFGHELLKAA